jgi:hypothetical protein
VRYRFLLPALLAAGAAASSQAACVPDSGVRIYYGNGMFITPARARVQALMMDRKIRPALPAGTRVTFSYAYNNSEEFFEQMLQVVKQAALGKASIKIPSLPSVPSIPKAPAVPSWASGLPESAIEEIRKIEKDATADTYVDDADLDAHVARYSADLAMGKRVIVVAHSQGNFYANESFKRLSSTAGFGIVAVATPASYTAGNGPYTTLTNDDLIKSIPNRRAPNTANGAAFVAATQNTDNHSFTGNYLAGDVSGPKIVEQVKTVLAGLSCPAGP